MCGIIGIISKNSDVIKDVVEGLERCSYRGYDSAGIASLDNSLIEVRKDVGKINEVDRKVNFSSLQGRIGIGHCRWATTGEVTKENAHPHIDCKKAIALVHNGIIENYAGLKEILKKEGHKFVSETDTEIIVHLIEKFYEGNLEDAVIKALSLVEGTYGIAVIHKDEEKIVAARNGSPVIIGIGKGENFVASDVSAILKYTKNVVYLEDREICTITKDSYFVRNLDNEEIKKKIEKIKWNLQQIEKRGFRDFMIKEIFEQPEAIKNCLSGRLGPTIKLTIHLDLEKTKKIVITACGTSWHSALVGKHLIESIAEIPVEVDYASEFRYRNPLVNPETLVIVISQSGETADTLAALKEAKSKGAKTLGLVNVVGSTIAREVDFGIYLHAGPEIGVASTKAFTNQVIALVLLAFYLRQKKGLVLDKKNLKELGKIPEKIKEVLQKNEEIKTIAKRFMNSANFLYLGRGINFPVALEGALKMKEISYIHAEGYPAAEMKHGPIALIDENMPVVFIATKSHGYNKILNNMEEVKTRKGKIITIATKGDKDIKRLSDYIIYVPETFEELSPIINVIPLQLLAYHIAVLKGLEPDYPKNLAKSVTVE